MKRPSVYSYTQTAPPGCNIHRLRTARQWTQRELAARCRPALDHTTIQRVEQNKGYTSDTLERIAAALRVTVADLFLPPELIDYTRLPPDVRQRVADSVADAAVAARYRQTG